MKREHQKALDILRENRTKLDELANFLYEKETITGEEFMEILGPEQNEKVTPLPVGNESAE